MPGKKDSSQGASFVTELVLHREVTEIDPDDLSDVEGFLDIRKGAQSQPNQYGRDAVIFLCVLLKTITAVDLELWVTTQPNAFDKGGSSSPSSPAADVDPWCKVDELSIAGNERVVFKDLVPGVYKVRVAGKTGAGTIFIHEQHSE